jgi:hypothetical protein
MGNIQAIQSLKKVSFEDIIDTVYKSNNTYLLINTLPITEQDCLLLHTIPISREEGTINQLLTTNKMHPIIIYGKNTGDLSVLAKYKQLSKLGFSEIMVYPGGMFEWLLLQEAYGQEMFPTTTEPKDMYAFRPIRTL